MCSKNDSDATYCSEVEQLLKAATTKSTKTIELRRSQRLSQRLTKSYVLSDNNKENIGITKLTENLKFGVECKYTQDIFTTQDLPEESIKKQSFSSNETVNRIRKSISVQAGVPLDLSRKSKVSTEETPQVELNVPKVEFQSFNGKMAKENINIANVQKLSPTIPNVYTKYSADTKYKRGLIETVDSTIENTTSINKKVSKRSTEKLISSKNKSSLVSDKIIKPVPNSRKTRKRGQTRKYSLKNPHKNIIDPHTNSSNEKYSKTFDRIGDLNHSQEIYSVHKKCYKRTKKRIQNRKENLDSISDKRIKLSNERTNNSISFNKDYAITRNVARKSNNSESKTKKANVLNQIQPVRRSQRKLHQSNIRTQSTESHYIPQNIKREPFILEDMRTKDISDQGLLTNTLQNNLTHVSNEVPASCRDFYLVPSWELRPDKMLQSAIVNSSQKLSGGNSANIENDYLKVKNELLSENFPEENVQTKSQIKYPTKKIKKLSGQQIYADKLNTNKLEKWSQKTDSKEFNRKLLLPCKAQEMRQSSESSQPKTIIETQSATSSKNYIKSFDKNQFKDKIQNARNYINRMSAYSNNCDIINTLETPPTESQDILKKSILPDVYPLHFKHQLPPGTIVRPDFEPTSTCTITSVGTVLDSPSSSPSLPESLYEHFQTKDIKDILNVERTSYRLYNYHIQALALILNIREEYLLKVLDKISNICPKVLKNIDKAVKAPFVPDNDIFATSPTELWASGDVVLNSESPTQRKI